MSLFRCARGAPARPRSRPRSCGPQGCSGSILCKSAPAELSGGQRQRVAVGRGIIRNPSAPLMDKPLSNLDASLRVKTRTEIKRLQRELKTTVVFVTHNQEKFMVLSGRIAVREGGVLQQYDAPMAIYRRPANLFVAGFIGSPEMDVLPGLDVPGGQGAGRLVGVRQHDPSPRPRAHRSTPSNSRANSRSSNPPAPRTSSTPGRPASRQGHLRGSARP